MDVANDGINKPLKANNVGVVFLDLKFFYRSKLLSGLNDFSNFICDLLPFHRTSKVYQKYEFLAVVFSFSGQKMTLHFEKVFASHICGDTQF